VTLPWTCPRCMGPVEPPGLMNSAWRCGRHGEVLPLQIHGQPTSPLIHAQARSAQVPVWLPWPLPAGWVVTGFARAGDERSGVQATALACSGPAPLGGQGELVLVAEEPGVGLGACFAGLEHADPGATMLRSASTAKVTARGRPTAMWAVGEHLDDRAAYIGEAEGLWLWAILWPADAGHLLADDLSVVDLRDEAATFDLPCGALSPRLTSP
jgi:hypothetical protein